MTRWLALVVALALPAWAQGPDDFRAKARITVAEEDALQRLVLPPEVYRDARADLGDVRVFNGAGEAVPIALATDPERAREAQVSGVLPQFSVTSLDVAPEHLGVVIRMSDGTLIGVRNRGGAKSQRVAAYILDASTIKLPMRALMVDWDPAKGAEVVPVRVDGSTDLRSWHPLASGVTLVHLEQGGRTLEQPRIPLPRSQEKYLRITWGGAVAFKLNGVKAEFDDRLKPPEREVVRVQGRKGDHDGEIKYDLGARYPVEAIRLLPVERNSVIPATFTIGDRAAGTHREVASGVFYRLARNGADVESPPLEIGRRAARRWVARVDPDSGAVGQALPDLEVQWRPAQVVFVARGDGPFTLAFGDPQAKSAYQSPRTLIPGYESHAEDALPLAKAGDVERNLTAESRLPEWMAGVPPRRIALWTILVAAVAVLGVMAWRLKKQAD